MSRDRDDYDRLDERKRRVLQGDETPRGSSRFQELREIRREQEQLRRRLYPTVRRD